MWSCSGGWEGALPCVPRFLFCLVISWVYPEVLLSYLVTACSRGVSSWCLWLVGQWPFLFCSNSHLCWPSPTVILLKLRSPQLWQCSLFNLHLSILHGQSERKSLSESPKVNVKSLSASDFAFNVSNCASPRTLAQRQEGCDNLVSPWTSAR